MLLFIFYIGLAGIGTAVTWKGSGLLELASDRLARHYRLPAIVQGAVIAAVGSSFPELSATVISTLLHGDFDLGVASIVGSAIFNILVIPGVSGLVGRRLQADINLVYKDVQFYIISVATLLLAFSFAVIYHPVSGADLVGSMTRPIALAPVLLYGLYLFVQQQDTREKWAAENSVQQNSRVSPLREWLRLIAGLLLIIAGVEGLLRSALGLGELLNTPSSLWGLTVVAAGTSLPDMFISVKTARKGQGVVSLANVLGSNIFDLLIAVPAGILIVGSSAVNFSIAAPLMGFLTLATIVLFTTLRTRLTLYRGEAVLLLVLYVLFVTWMILETTGVTGLVF
ncbi:MAG: sodium:calcium antiporter [candidate division KSB1 bacterium]|nr:sodium:calcium antiporter [candidate division KSB1 bacterium]